MGQADGDAIQGGTLMIKRIVLLAMVVGGGGLMYLASQLDPHLLQAGQTVFPGVLFPIGGISVLAAWGYCLYWAIRTQRGGWIFTDLFLSGLAIILHPLFGPVGEP